MWKEFERLATVDPRGWTTTYYEGRFLASVEYGGDIKISFVYGRNNPSLRWVRVFPGGALLGWWDLRKLDKFLDHLIRSTAKQCSLDAARKIVAASTAEVQAAMRELEADLEAQFADLEAADRKERRKLTESPVAHGFFKGAIKQLNEME